MKEHGPHHKIMNLLCVIAGNGEMLMEFENLSQDGKRMVKRIVDASHESAFLIREVLEPSRELFRDK